MPWSSGDSLNSFNLNQKASLGSWFNVREYGAVGNGVANDTTAISSVISAAQNATAFFPPGTYLFTPTLSIATQCSIVLAEGAILQSIASSYANRGAIEISTNSVRVYGPGTIDFNRAGQTGSSQSGLHINANDCVIDGVRFINIANAGVVVRAGDRNKIVNNHLSGSSFYGIFLRASSQNTGCSYNLIENNYIEHSRCSEVAIKVWGHDTSGQERSNSTGNSVIGNTVRMTTRTELNGTAANAMGVEARLAPYTVVQGNNIRGGLMGVSMTWRSDYGAVTGNAIDAVQEAGVEVASCGRASVTGNTISGTTSSNILRAVSVDGTAAGTLPQTVNDVTVTGNSIQTCRYGVYTSAYTRVAITGNTISGITGTNAAGIYATISQDIAVANNVILSDTSADAGIWLSTITRGTVTGNIVPGTSNVAAIWIDNSNSSQIRVVGNVVAASHNNRYAAPSGENLDILFISNSPNEMITAIADDATPTLSHGFEGTLRVLGSATTITDFDDGTMGQTITVIGAGNVTIANGANILLSGAANFSMTSNDVLTLKMFQPTVWHEIGRSVN